MDRKERLDLVLALVRSRPGITAEALAAEFGISPRTVFRDLGYLRDRGFPIDSDVGRGGGLRVPASWAMGRIHFTPEQGVCLLLALAVSEKLRFPIFQGELRDARKKLSAAFPPHEKRLMSCLQERIFVGTPASEAVRSSYKSPRTALMDRLQHAFVQELRMRIEYRDEHGRTTRRLFEPHAISIHWPVWYLLGWDHLREAARIFRIDRLRSIEIMEDERFRPRPTEIMAELDYGVYPPLR